MEAIDKLKLLVAWESEPALTEDDLEATLASAALPDANGAVPLSDDWMPTYSLFAAAAEAWLIKAARAAATVEIDPPESGVVTSKVFDNCRAMARIYGRKSSVTITTS